MPKFGQKWIFLEKRTLSVFEYSNHLLLRKKSEKTNDPFLRKMPNWQTDRKTDIGDFVGPSVGRGSNKWVPIWIYSRGQLNTLWIYKQPPSDLLLRKVFLKIQNLQETIFKNSCVGGFFKITFFTEHLQWLLLWIIFIIFCNWLHWVDNNFYLESDFFCVCEILLSLFGYCFLGSHTGSNACENSCIIFQMIPGKTI